MNRDSSVTSSIKSSFWRTIISANCPPNSSCGTRVVSAREHYHERDAVTMEQIDNRQNDRTWAIVVQPPPTSSDIVKIRRRFWFWRILSQRKDLVVFVDDEVKLNKKVPTGLSRGCGTSLIPQHFGNATYQQDSATEDRRKRTQTWCKTNLPEFITSAEWPLQS